MAYRLGERFGIGRPVVAAHRGFSARYPENTLLAFEKAAQLGVDMVELDIAISADGVPMLYHDDALEAKSSPLAGGIRNHTREQLRQVRIGAKLGMEDAPLATLEEFCDLYARYPQIAVNVDLKPGCGVDVTIDPVLRILEAQGFLERCIFNSLDGEITRYLHDHTDFITVGPPTGFPGNVNHIPGADGTYGHAGRRLHARQRPDPGERGLLALHRENPRHRARHRRAHRQTRAGLRRSHRALRRPPPHAETAGRI